MDFQNTTKVNNVIRGKLEKKEKKRHREVRFYLKMKTTRGKIQYNLKQGCEVIEYLFFSSSSFLTFSLAFLWSTDPRLGLEDLCIGDSDVALLFCLLYRLGVGERLLRCLGDGDRLLRRRGEIERLFRLYNNKRYLRMTEFWT